MFCFDDSYTDNILGENAETDNLTDDELRGIDGAIGLDPVNDEGLVVETLVGGAENGAATDDLDRLTLAHSDVDRVGNKDGRSADTNLLGHTSVNGVGTISIEGGCGVTNVIVTLELKAEERRNSASLGTETVDVVVDEEVSHVEVEELADGELGTRGTHRSHVNSVVLYTIPFFVRFFSIILFIVYITYTTRRITLLLQGNDFTS